MAELSKRQESTLTKLAEMKVSLDKATKAREKAQTIYESWIKRAVDAGVPPVEVARVAGVSRARVSQIAPVTKGPKPRVHAQKNDVSASGVTEPATVPTLPDTVPLLSGIASTRARRPYGRATVFRDGAVSIAGLLAEVPEGLSSCRVFLTGKPPAVPASGATKAEAVRDWALSDPGEGWATTSHYLGDPDLPVLRFEHADGRKVTVLRAASWWGETDADVATCETAWRVLGEALDRIPAFAGAGLADTPATTGRALWLRTIPEGKSYPVLSDELRELIGSTSGQGRIELRPEPAQADRAEFTYLDGRFMYAALTWGMPVGEPKRWTGAQMDAADARTFSDLIRGRGRWLITCTVPADWNHVGMFMAPHEDRSRPGWCYPDQPGQTFTTWADGSEIWAGMERGWEPIIHEGITWDEGKPLDAWRNALVSVWESASQSPSPAAKLGAKAVRSLLLFALGAFAARAHDVTRSAPIDGPEPVVPAGTEVRRVGDNLVWTEKGQQSAWTLQTAHPEWSATVWARARTRLLTARGVNQERIGALSLPRDQVVAFATDALYLAGDPGWADDGKPGRFRSKGTRPGAFEWPETYADLYQLRDEAEASQ